MDPQVSQVLDTGWQHFVNPVIRVVLDVRKSSNGDLESFKLRILWRMGFDSDTMDVDQNEVIFEDLELLSFSTLSPQQPRQAHQAQGLPLKAVYRDSVVGIRYIHPIVTQGASPVYRRFQITFMSSPAASQFINAICKVCPCKYNGTPNVIRDVTMKPTLTQHAGTGSQKHPSEPISGVSATRLLPASQVESRLPNLQSSPLLQSTQGLVLSSSPSDPQPALHSSLNISTSSQPSAPSLCLRNQKITPQGSQYTNMNTVPEFTPSLVVSNSKKATRTDHSSSSNNSSLPESSPPRSSLNNSTNRMPPPPLPTSSSTIIHPLTTSHESQQTPQDRFMTSLRETPALYDLSHEELENLVAKVVGEDGFPKLLKSLDAMWRVKGFLES